MRRTRQLYVIDILGRKTNGPRSRPHGAKWKAIAAVARFRAASIMRRDDDQAGCLLTTLELAPHEAWRHVTRGRPAALPCCRAVGGMLLPSLLAPPLSVSALWLGYRLHASSCQLPPTPAADATTRTGNPPPGTSVGTLAGLPPPTPIRATRATDPCTGHAARTRRPAPPSRRGHCDAIVS